MLNKFNKPLTVYVDKTMPDQLTTANVTPIYP